MFMHFSKISGFVRKTPMPIKMGLPAFAVGIVLGVSGPVLAAVTSSAIGYYGPIDGYNYENQADLSLSGGIFVPETAVSTQQGASTPAGYMGCNARLFNTNTGALVQQSGMIYDNSSGNNFSVEQDDLTSRTGSYYSYGITAAYNGNGYDYYYTFKSPSLTN